MHYTVSVAGDCSLVNFISLMLKLEMTSVAEGMTLAMVIDHVDLCLATALE